MTISHAMSIAFLGMILIASPVTADDSTRRPMETFEIDGHKAFVYAPSNLAPGKPWVWYAPTIRHVLIMKHPFYVENLMKAGITIAGVDLGEVRGSPESTEMFSKFYDAMVRQGWSPKPVLLGQSRGGLMMLAWGMRNPDKVKAFAGIYPVCNLTSWPLRFSRTETLADYGMTEEELRARLAEVNPIDNLEGLRAAKVPMFVVHGDADKSVPLEDNTALLAERYRAGGGSIEVKVIPGRGHEVSPPFFECQELVDFILAHASDQGFE
jgi:predicted esterase